jgi:hypothetical protein
MLEREEKYGGVGRLPSCDDDHAGVVFESGRAGRCGYVLLFDGFEEPGYDVLGHLLCVPGLSPVSLGERVKIWK